MTSLACSVRIHRWQRTVELILDDCIKFIITGACGINYKGIAGGWRYRKCKEWTEISERWHTCRKCRRTFPPHISHRIFHFPDTLRNPGNSETWRFHYVFSYKSCKPRPRGFREKGHKFPGLRVSSVFGCFRLFSGLRNLWKPFCKVTDVVCLTHLDLRPVVRLSIPLVSCQIRWDKLSAIVEHLGSAIDTVDGISVLASRWFEV